MYGFEVIGMELWLIKVIESLETEVEEEGCRRTESECVFCSGTEEERESSTVKIREYFIPFPRSIRQSHSIYRKR